MQPRRNSAVKRGVRPHDVTKGMKRIRHRYSESESLDLFDALGRKSGYRIGDPADSERFVSDVRAALNRANTTPIILHGRRAEAMFGFVVASLHGCKLIRQEDVGDVYSADDTIATPDYRLVLNSGEEFFVEVKNCNNTNPERPIRFRSDYISALERYAAIFGTSVKVAIYWSRWHIWTLISVQHLPVVGNDRAVNLLKALQINEMASLGDFSIGTLPPLKIRILTDPTKPHAVSEFSPASSDIEFTIGEVKFYCGESRIEDAREKSIAFYLMMHGKWTEKEPVADIQDGELKAIDFVKVPDEFNAGQGFAIVGEVSSMISDAYADLTVGGGGIHRLTPPLEPGSLGIVIDPNYKGTHLPLWRIHLKPNYDE